MRKLDWIGSIAVLTVCLTAFTIWGSSCEGGFESQCVTAGGSYTYDSTHENGIIESCKLP